MKRSRLLLLAVLGSSSFAWAGEPGPSASPPGSLSRRLDYAKKAPVPSAVGSAKHTLAPAASVLPEVVMTPKVRWRTAVGDLATALERGEIQRHELKARYAELNKTRATRRKARLDSLEQEIGKEVFAQRHVQVEIAKHNRRIALLERARLVTESELDGMRKARAILRIDRLRTKEDDRYDNWLLGLKAARAAEATPPVASPSPSNAPPKRGTP